jgi:protein-glutamine gamma-glutamyltransferase
MTRESIFVRLFHASAYAAAFATLVVPLGPAVVVTAAAAGAFAGSLAGSRLGESRLRSLVLLLVLPLALLLAAVSEAIFGGSFAVASSMGPEASLAASDSLAFFFVTCGVVLTLRALGRRHRTVGALEVVIVGVSAAELFAVHRGGAINRPFELADRVLSLGGDPADVLLAIGAAGAVVVAILLLRATRLRRGLFHLLAALLLLGVLGSLFPIFDVPIPDVASTGVGLRNESRPTRGESGRDQEDLDFESSGSRGGDRPPVAVVTFHNDYSPPGGVYFFRQASLSQWNGNRLVHAGGEVDRDTADRFPHPEIRVERPPSPRGRAEILTSVGLLAEHFRPFGLESPIRFESAVNPDPRRFRRTYRVVSQALEATDVELLGATAGDPSWKEATRRHYQSGPDDARYRELAERILVEMLPPDLREEPLAQVRAITAWLEREGTYSLQVPPPPPTEEPTAAFLFGDLVGYCVHFSHAATLLFRSIGLPARVATGYAIPEQARRGGSALLLNDAFSHAWAEVYLGGVGWLVADVQPLRSLDPPPPLPDADLTRLLGELRRGESRDELASDQPEKQLISLRELVEHVWKIAVAAGLAALLVLYGLKAWRRLTGRGSATRVYRARLDALAELGHRRRPGETPEGFARRLEAAFPSLGPLTEAHLASAFGGRPRVDPTQLRDLDARVRAEVSRHNHLLRRIVAMIDPVSWLGSR